MSCVSEYSEDAGCINGEWYDSCGADECYGLCVYIGLCGCEGCDEENCCAR